MCLIVASEKGAIPKRAEVDNAQWHNEDGFGIVYLEEGTLKTKYTLEPSWNDVWDIFKSVEGKPYVAHFRYATHGDVTRENAHPFMVVKRQLYVAHNGVIDIDCGFSDRSDTWHFVQSVLKPRGMNCLRRKTLKALGRILGKNNKLAFLDIYGKVSIVNKAQGVTAGDIWFSNEYSIRPGWSATLKPKLITGIITNFAKDDKRGKIGERYVYENEVDCDFCNVLTLHLNAVEDCWICDKCIDQYREELRLEATEEAYQNFQGGDIDGYSFDNPTQRRGVEQLPKHYQK